LANSKMTQLWFSKAKGDLLAAKYLEQAGDDHLYVSIAFHCQQSAEKAIKGYLTYNNKRVLKTHDMEKLLKTLHSIDPDLSAELGALNDFTNYAVLYRYPDTELEIKPLTRNKIKEVIALTDKAFTLLAKEIGGG